jgi:gliding motility-associated-like protein
MNSTLFFCKPFKKGLRLFVLMLVLLPALLKAQNSFRIPNRLEVNNLQPVNYPAFQGNLKTTATCPTGPVGLAGQDTLGNTVTNGQVFACNATPFYIYVPSVAGNIASPCVETEYTNFHNNLATNGTETFYEGGVKLTCIGPAGSGCQFPIGNGTGIPGLPWGVTLSLLDPNQQHDFVFCRQGTITTTTITLLDCWTGAQLPSVPTSTVFSNTNPPNTATCFTMNLAANTDIGTAVYVISPTVTPGAFLDLHDGEAYVNTALLAPGAYNVTYSFTPSASSGCGMVTGTFSFSIAPNISVTVNSPTVCPGANATLTANASNGTAPYTYSWTPSTGLSATTGSVVTVNNPTTTTVYTVTVMNGGCTATATSTVTVPTFTVNKATICSGDSATLIASNSSLSYTWTPATGLNTTANDTVKASPATTIVYTITATGASCPPITLTDSVIVKLSPTITVFSPTVCSGTTATITAVGAATYTWSTLTNLTSSVTGDTVYISNPTTNLTYTAYGTAPNGCKDSAVSTVTASNYLGIVSGTPVNVCSGYSFGLSAVGASTYTWSSNSPANLNFGLDTSWHVQTSVANVGTYTVAIYGESHSGTFCVGHDTVYVTVYQTPTVTVAGNPNPAICSGTSTTLTVNSSGPPIATYTWSPSTGLSTSTQSTTVASPTVTTTYTATGTSAVGCSSSAIFTVSVIPVPSFTVNSPTSCFGNTDSLKVSLTTPTSGAQTYSWSPAAGLNVTTGTVVAATPTAQGVYSYSVTGTNTISTSSLTCAFTATLFVGALPLPTVTVSTAAICAGNTATLTAGGTATSYTWSSSSATYTANTNMLTDSPAATTIYTVTGSGGGCMASATTTITVNNVPTFTISNSNPVFCKGDSSALAIVPTSTTAATYTWAPSGSNNTSLTVHPTTTTVYTVNATATSPGSCPSTSQTTVTVHQLPILTASTNTTICNGNSTTLIVTPSVGTAPYTYTWSPIASLSGSTNTATVTASPIVNTTYSVTGQDSFGCHADTATVTVTVTTPTVTASSNSPVCKGQAINLSANTNGTTYTWSATNGYSSHLQNPIISNATPTNSAVYSVTVMLGSCTATNTVAVIVDSPTVSVTPTTATVCPGGAVTYTASGASTYTWSPSAQFSPANGNIVTAHPLSSTTIYTVMGTDAANCVATATTTIHVDSIVANMIASPATGDAPLDVQFINHSVNASSYVWNFGNNSSNFTTGNVNDTAKTIYPNQGTYTVVLTASSTTGALTCIDNDTLVIIVTESYSLVIPNIFTPNGDGLNENFVVKSEGVSTFSMEIFDRWGLKMFSTTSVTGEWDGKTVGGKDVPADTYFYLINATSSKTGKSQAYKGYLTLIR